MFRICLVVAFDGSHLFLVCSVKFFVDPKGIHFLTLDQCQCSININTLFWNNHSISFCNIRHIHLSLVTEPPHNGGVAMPQMMLLPFFRANNWRVTGCQRDEAYHLSMILYWREEHLQLPCAAIFVAKSIWTTHLWQLGFLLKHRCTQKRDVLKRGWFWENLNEFEVIQTFGMLLVLMFHLGIYTSWM